MPRGRRNPLPDGVRPAWTHVVGVDAARVVVSEDLARDRRLSLRWWDEEKQNWRRKALGRALERNRRGEPTEDAVKWAIGEATKKSAALTLGIGETVVTPPSLFTIGETRAAITDKETGKYPHQTPFRDELLRALDYAAVVWGPLTPWAKIDDDAWTKLIRRRLESLLLRGKQGVRTTELTVSRLATAARWLRRTKRIPAEAGHPPDTFKQDIREHWRGITGATRAPAVNRPRHSLDELRRILAMAGVVDPRLGLLLAVGAEYRLGQVVRAKRSDLDVAARSLVVYGQGAKRGETIDFTDGQMAAVFTALGGYLEESERQYLADGTDYLLFPSGRLQRRRQRTGHRSTEDVIVLGRGVKRDRFLSKKWITTRFHLAEAAAGVPTIPGRGPYGIRRQNVDAAKAEGISREGLQATGGWSSTKIPDEVYAEQTNKLGREEAKRIRAKTRGET